MNYELIPLSHFIQYLGPFRVLSQNTINWMFYNLQQFISQSVDVKSKFSVDSMSGEALLPGSDRAFSLCTFLGINERVLWDLFYKGTNLISEDSIFLT